MSAPSKAPITEKPKSVFDGLHYPAFQGFPQCPIPNNESSIAKKARAAPICNFYFTKTTNGKKQFVEPHHYESSSTPSEGIIGEAMARGRLALDVTDRDAKGKGEVALLEKEAGFEMVEKNDEDDEDDEDAVVVDDDDIEGIVEEDDDYVKV